MQRVFGLDGQASPRRGGRLRLIATSSDPRVPERLVAHLDKLSRRLAQRASGWGSAACSNLKGIGTNTEFCGRSNQHPYEVLLGVQGIEHRTTRVQKAPIMSLLLGRGDSQNTARGLALIGLSGAS